MTRELNLQELLAILQANNRVSLLLENSTDYYYSLLNKLLATIPITQRPLTRQGTYMLCVNDVISPPKPLVFTKYFREPALHWIKHKCYTKAPVGSKEYNDYWDEQERRCRFGLQVGDLWITGRHYFYLNFYPIKRIPSREYLEYNPLASANEKVAEMAGFWEIDLAFWYAKELGMQNAELGFDQCHMAILKARRGGFSFKEAVDGIWNYNFIPYSKSGYYAATKDYLTKDGIFNKVQAGLDHLNIYTDWYKNRQSIDNTFHKKASYFDERGEQGFQSELIATVLDEPDKARGGDKKKITFEEGGAFPHVLKAWEICLPQVTQGGITTGFMTIFGTGGTKNDEGLIGLETIFYDPAAYKCLAFPNHWEDDESSECGFFFPYFMGIEQAMDKDGNINRESAIAYTQKERDIRAKAKNNSTLASFIAENANIPSEALTRPSNRIFNVAELKKQEMRIKSNTVIQSMIKYGELVRIGKKVSFKPMPYLDAQPVDYYPIPKGDHKKGCVTVFQSPFELNDEVPDDMYFIVCDPYAQDEAPNSDSVASVQVVKRANKLDIRSNDCIVAIYVGRPNIIEDFYDILFKLSDYYNAKIQSSILGGGQGIISYARTNQKLHRLYHSPELLESKEYNSSRNKSYFINEQKHKVTLLHELNNWIMQPRGITEDGEIVLNLHVIYDIGLLKELQKYNDTGNFDRVSSAIFIPLMLNELQNVEVQEMQQDQDTFFSRKLFAEGVKTSFMGTPLLGSNKYLTNY